MKNNILFFIGIVLMVVLGIGTSFIVSSYFFKPANTVNINVTNTPTVEPTLEGEELLDITDFPNITMTALPKGSAK